MPLVVLDDDLEASARWHRIVYVTNALEAHERAAGLLDGDSLYRPAAE